MGVSPKILAYSEAILGLFSESFKVTAASVAKTLDLTMELCVKDQIVKAGRLLKLKVVEILKSLILDIRESHRDVAVPVIRDHVEPIYDKCGADKGKLRYHSTSLDFLLT